MAARPSAPRRTEPEDLLDDAHPEERGPALWLRLLALVGALSFLMLGLSSMAPLLQPSPPPGPPPDPRRGPVG